MEAKESAVNVVLRFSVSSVNLRHIRFQVFEGDEGGNKSLTDSSVSYRHKATLVESKWRSVSRMLLITVLRKK